MKLDQLNKRRILVKATKRKESVPRTNTGRRGENFVPKDESLAHVESFDSIFEYDEEISGMKPANELQKHVIEQESSFIVMGDAPDISLEREETSYTVLEDSTEDSVIENKSLDYKICSFVKEDGERCKRQAPKGGDYCKPHRKVLNML